MIKKIILCILFCPTAIFGQKIPQSTMEYISKDAILLYRKKYNNDKMLFLINENNINIVDKIKNDSITFIKRENVPKEIMKMKNKRESLFFLKEVKVINDSIVHFRFDRYSVEITKIKRNVFGKVKNIDVEYLNLPNGTYEYDCPTYIYNYNKATDSWKVMNWSECYEWTKKTEEMYWEKYIKERLRKIEEKKILEKIEEEKILKRKRASVKQKN
ncbi:MAG TPA: hypothetical protein VF677_16755 [Flavobacterium sp.]|jgi:hypothetical protein